MADKNRVTTDPTTAMLFIKALDDNASVKCSTYTQAWYVEARIEISDGVCLTGITEHEPTPDEAVLAFLARLTAVDVNQFSQVLVSNACSDGRRHWRWNGATFVNEPVEQFLEAKRA